MCFSATASFVAGGVLSVAGVLTVVKTKKKRELPLASIPLLLGVQQLIEGIVWISFGSPVINTVATYAYSFFSHVLWPVFIPIAVLLIERERGRKRMLKVLSVIGLGVGAFLLYYIAAGPVTACIVNKSIDYQSLHVYPYATMVLYLIAVCGAPLVSSHKVVKIFGVALMISFAISVWFYTTTFFSVWCFFSAILSALLYWQIGSRRS